MITRQMISKTWKWFRFLFLPPAPAILFWSTSKVSRRHTTMGYLCSTLTQASSLCLSHLYTHILWHAEMCLLLKRRTQSKTHTNTVPFTVPLLPPVSFTPLILKLLTSVPRQVSFCQSRHTQHPRNRSSTKHHELRSLTFPLSIPPLLLHFFHFFHSQTYLLPPVSFPLTELINRFGEV